MRGEELGLKQRSETTGFETEKKLEKLGIKEWSGAWEDKSGVLLLVFVFLSPSLFNLTHIKI